MTEHLVFFLEEPSAEDFLRAFLPTIGLPMPQVHFVVFQGKQDLERRLVRRMRGWIRPNTHFVVMRDQDAGDCRAIKQGLQALCAEAGHPQATVRVACRELESFFVGDWEAVGRGYGLESLAKLAAKAKYQDPDHLHAPSVELARELPGYQKRDGARRISPHLRPERNRSNSFQVLYRSLKAIAH